MTNGQLGSWKEIAAYLGCDVTTAMRWERSRGLPVHRLPGARRSGVYALQTELDRWRASADAAAPPRPGLRRFLPLALGALAALVAAAATVATLVAGHQRTRTRVDHLEITASEILTKAEGERVVWRRSFGGRQVFHRGDDTLRPTPRSAIADLDGDGSPEILAAVDLIDGGTARHAELYCFSSAGEVRWRKTFREELTFSAGRFGPIWSDGHVVVTNIDGEPHVLWSQNTDTWWPSVLLVLDRNGQERHRWVHAGSIRAIDVMERKGRPLLLVGGVSNAYRAGYLAVLDGGSVRGQGPVPAASQYECRSCEPGVPLLYLLFPPSDINAATGLPYNFVRLIKASPSLVEVNTLESGPPSEPIAELVFDFSPDFALRSARASDSWPSHEMLERSGRLDHTAADCPIYRKGPPIVRGWTPTGGWKDVLPGAPPPPW